MKNLKKLFQTAYTFKFSLQNTFKDQLSIESTGPLNISLIADKRLLNQFFNFIGQTQDTNLIYQNHFVNEGNNKMKLEITMIDEQIKLNGKPIYLNTNN